MNSTIFKNLYSVSQDKHSTFWNDTVSLNNNKKLELIFYQFEAELEKVYPDVIELQKIGSAFILDLIDIKTKFPENNNTLNFCQFYAGNIILNSIITSKMFNYAFDWIANCLSPEISTAQKREIEDGRIAQFLESNFDFIRKHLPDAFALFSKNLFYYSRVTGGHNQLCLNYLKYYFPLLARLYDNPYLGNDSNLLTAYAESLIQISTWTEQHNLENEAHNKP
jgi:hypothetical protein